MCQLSYLKSFYAFRTDVRVFEVRKVKQNHQKMKLKNKHLKQSMFVFRYIMHGVIDISKCSAVISWRRIV